MKALKIGMMLSSGGIFLLFAWTGVQKFLLPDIPIWYQVFGQFLVSLVLAGLLEIFAKVDRIVRRRPKTEPDTFVDEDPAWFDDFVPPDDDEEEIWKQLPR